MRARANGECLHVLSWHRRGGILDESRRGLVAIAGWSGPGRQALVGRWEKFAAERFRVCDGDMGARSRRQRPRLPPPG